MTDLEHVSFEISVRADSLKRTASGQLVGPIHVLIGGAAFPEEPWIDFPGIILTWWSDALLALLRDEAQQAEWLFMDGPYHIRISRTKHGCVQIQSVTVGFGGASVETTSLVATDVVVRALRRAVNEILRRASEVGHAENERELSRVLSMLSVAR